MSATLVSLKNIAASLGATAGSSEIVEMAKGLEGSIIIMQKALEESDDDDDEEEDGDDDDYDDVPAPGVNDMKLGTDFSLYNETDDDGVVYLNALPPMETLAKGINAALDNDRQMARYIHQMRQENANLRGEVRAMAKALNALIALQVANAGQSAQLSKAVVTIGSGLAGIGGGSGMSPVVRNVLQKHLDAPQTTTSGETVTITKATLAKAMGQQIITPAQLRHFKGSGRFHTDAALHDSILSEIAALGA